MKIREENSGEKRRDEIQSSQGHLEKRKDFPDSGK